jgi:hypothetical protein
MENFNVIEFHRARDFSRKLNATFEFIKQNFKGLGKSILMIAGPPVLVASLIIGSFIGEFTSFTQQAALNGGRVEGMENYFLSISFWLQIILMIVFLTLSSIMNIATINNYLVLYGEKRTNKIEVSEVWARVRSTFWMYFRTMLLFMVLIIAAYIVLLIPIGILGVISPFLVFFGFVFFFCGLIYLIFGASLTFIIRAFENNGFFVAIGRSFKLVKDKWWSTFGLITVLYLIMGITSYIFIMPWYIITMMSALHSTSIDTFQGPSEGWQLMTILIFTLYYLAQMILAALPNIGIAFQYFNLVELKEAKGLMTQIETLGQPQTPPPAQDEHY